MFTKQKENETPHLQELSGSPSMTSVSDVAKGGKPENVQEEIIREAKAIYGRRYEGDEDGEKSDLECTVDDLQEAYSMLFESLAKISRA